MVYIRNDIIPLYKISVEFEFVEHIRRVLGTALASSVHVAGVILLDTAFLVAAKCVASQVRVLVLEVLLGAVCLLRGGKLSENE